MKGVNPTAVLVHAALALVAATASGGAHGTNSPSAGWRNITGVIDVTAAPFNADPSGVTDATSGLQAAINYALRFRATILVPLGVYRVTDTLNLTCFNRSNDAIVVGEVLGSAEANTARLAAVAPAVYPSLAKISGHRHTRPVLYLPPSTHGYGDPKYFVFFFRMSKIGSGKVSSAHLPPQSLASTLISLADQCPLCTHRTRCDSQWGSLL